MALLSGRLPPHECYQRTVGSWVCKGGNQYGYGKNPEEAYHDWVYFIRYNSDGRNWCG